MGVSGKPEEQEQKAFFNCLRGEFADVLGYDEEEQVYRAIIVATADLYDSQAFISSSGRRVSKKMENALHMGYQPATPDIILMVRSGEYSGLVIEMKSQRGHATKSQRKTLAFLRTQGFSCHVCKGFAAALDIWLTYLGM